MMKVGACMLGALYLLFGSAAYAQVQPEFSWDTIPRWIIMRSTKNISNASVERLAGHYQVVVMEKSNTQGLGSTEAGDANLANRLKSYNPDIVNLAYWNSFYCWPSYDACDEFYANWQAWSRETVLDTGYRMKLNHSNAAMRQWWVDTAVGLYDSTPSIDGMFIDTLRSLAVTMMDELYAALPGSALTAGNTVEMMPNGWLESRPIDGSYNDSLGRSANEIVERINFYRNDNLANGKMVLARGAPYADASDPKPGTLAGQLAWVERNVDFDLAIYLMIAEEGAYFRYGDHVYAGSGENAKNYIWDTSYMEVFQKPLGRPLGNPVKNGYLYTRSFEYLDVWVNVDTGETGFTWFDSPRSIPTMARWDLDDGSGTVVSDSSGNGFDATMSGAAWVGGVDGSALDFNGSSSTVTLPASAFASIDDEITVSMWVYGSDNQPRNDSIFYAVNASGGRVLNVHLPWGDGSVYWDAGNDGGFDRINKAALPADYKGQWNHWVFTKNAATGEMAIYLNGGLWHSGTGMTKSMAGITAAALGSQISGMNYNGMIDEVRLYNVMLSDNEVAVLFNSSPRYSFWAASYGLTGNDAQAGADVENGGMGDGYVNLVEFALGMNPTNADAGSRDWTEVSSEGGTNWFDYVHYRRTNYVNEGLSYLLIDSTNLVNSVVHTNTQDHILVGPAVDGYQPVTNRYEVDGPAKFIEFIIKQDR